MKAVELWNLLRARLGAARAARHRVVLQHLGLLDTERGELHDTLAAVGDSLGVQLELDSHQGDILLVDSHFAAGVSPQLTEAYAEGRPVVVADLNTDARLIGALDRVQRSQRQLLEQLRELDLVRRRADVSRRRARTAAGGPGSEWDPDFDSRIDADQLAPAEVDHAAWQLVQSVRRGRANPSAPALSASYGPGAHLRFDFRVGLVSLDPLALQRLRVRRELPQPADGVQPRAASSLLEIDEALWAMGVAAGPLPLLDAPADWWHRALAAIPGARVDRVTRVPRCLEMARRLAEGPLTPSQLRRLSRVGVADVRGFLQAGLLLQMIRWLPESAAG